MHDIKITIFEEILNPVLLWAGILWKSACVEGICPHWAKCDVCVYLIGTESGTFQGRLLLGQQNT